MQSSGWLGPGAAAVPAPAPAAKKASFAASVGSTAGKPETPGERKVGFAGAAEATDAEDEIMNREVFAAARISAPGDQKAKSKPGKVRYDNTLGEVVFKDSPSHTIVECMKKGLRKSILNISDEKKARELDPRKDFEYKAKMRFGKDVKASAGTHKGKGKAKGKKSPARSPISPPATTDAHDTGEGTEAEEKFEFTSYAPMCYRHVREFIGVDWREFMEELCNNEWTVSGAGKSSALLYFAGRRYVIKTMTPEESKFLRHILHRYYHHVRNNPHTLLPKYFGHYSVTPQSTGKKIPFIVMNNVFEAGGNHISEKYDLKGSTVGRFANPDERILKDLDIKQHILIGPRRRKIIVAQIFRDSHFLCKCGIMDYSYLLGIHRPMSAAGRQRVCLTHYDDERCLQADDGGMLNEGGGLEHAGEIYYGGIIDILQEYTARKRGETLLKGITSDRKGISAVPPDEYAARFCNFLQRMIL
eukprot:TRINITY_DN32130_c0_g1_i1.p1 TRINITY_DN32130_c0_g1~~TRINITY_DN32130_c0_g1_i1.p1  ORF type:complete len:496 (+),score=170.89 TRINITY_DN32130_c0_g1_i1:72-1490(+)